MNDSLFHVRNHDWTGRDFRAVYTARATPFKRIGLAREVVDVALVVNRNFVSGVVGLDETYQEVVPKYLNSGHLSPDELTGLYNRSTCGLILSNMEGACFTVVEYLLCGIPVVSTKPEHAIGLGGREIWLDESNSIYVDPDPAAINDAVEMWCQRGFEPREIQAGCLAEMIRQRQMLADILEPIMLKYSSSVSAETLILGDESWFPTSVKRHKFSAESVVLNLDDAIALLSGN